MHIFLFDIDGTLILSCGAGQAAFEQTFVEVFGIAKWRGNVTFAGRSDRAIVRDLFHMHNLPDSQQNWNQFKTEYLKRLPSSLNQCDGSVLPGVEALLQALTARDDVAVGLLTGNIQEGAYTKLGHFGLDGYFPFGGFGDEHGDRNAIATAACETAHRHFNQNGDVKKNDKKIKANDNTFIVIGDTPNDVSCAKSVGAVSVAVATGFCSSDDLLASDPDLLLTDLSDPTELFHYCNL